MSYKFENNSPIYLQIVEKMRIDIVSGNLKIGDKIGSVRDLALEFKVNPNTMQRALLELEDEGLIHTERTNGKFVTTNDKLLKKVKDSLADKKAKEYFNYLKSLGINKEDALKKLEKIGEK